MRLTSAVPPSNRVTLTYNGDGKRVKKQNPTQTKKFLYDFEKVLQESDAGDVLTSSYTSTQDQYGDLVSAYDGTNTSYFQHDALGSTDALLDDTQTATDRYRFRGFGLESHYSGSSTNPLTFVGQKSYYRDSEIDLYFLSASYYDPTTARFLSEDPIGYRDDINLYRYVRNNPINHIDPSGTELYIAQFRSWGQEGKTQLERRLGNALGGDRNPSLQYGGDFRNRYESWLTWSSVYKIRLFESLTADNWRNLYFASASDPSTLVPPDLPPQYERLYRMALESATMRAPLLETLRDEIETNVIAKKSEYRCDYVSSPLQFDSSRYLACSYSQIDNDDPTLVSLGALLRRVGDFGLNLVSQALLDLGRIGRIALTALLRLVPNVDVDKFFDNIENLGQQIVAIATAIIRNPVGFASNLIAGIGMGFRSYFCDLWENLKESALDWVKRQIPVLASLTLPNPLTLQKLGTKTKGTIMFSIDVSAARP